MARGKAYPPDLARYVEDHWPAGRPLRVPHDLLCEALSTAFQASLSSEEGRPIRFRLLITPAEDLPENGVPNDGALRLRFAPTRSLHADELRRLLGRGVAEIHLALPESDDVDEDQAATRMARAIAGAGVRVEQAHFGQSSLISDARGMLRVAGACLERVNAIDGVLLLTGEANRPVDAGTTLGGCAVATSSSRGRPDARRYCCLHSELQK